MTDTTPDPLGERDDIVAAFQINDRAVRGRVVRFGPVMDQILAAHDYPEPVARMLGEAVMLAALVGDSLKFDGRLIVQASGDGPVRFVVAEHVAGEGVRGYAKIAREEVEAALAAETDADNRVKTLLGTGAFAMTIDYGGEKDLYQGIVPLEGASLSQCAERYFDQSEQIPTRIRLAIGESWDGEGQHSWRGGGAMIQALAADETRGDPEEDWTHALALFETVEDAELLDPDLSAGTVLYRLFNEDGVRLFEASDIKRRCSCERERLMQIIANFPAEDRAAMVTDGEIIMTCEYCNRDWRFKPDEIGA